MYSKLKYALAISGAIVLTVLGSGASGIASAGAGAHGPKVNITSKYIADASDYTLAGSIRGYADLKKLTVTVNGGQEQVVPLAAEFKLPVKLNAGQNEILLKTVDNAGHTATNMVIVTFQGSGQGGAFSVSQSALASWQKMQKKQMQALRKELAKEPEPAATQSTAESLKALNNSAAELRKTLASLGAATTPTPESAADASVAEKKAPPEKRIDITAPLIEITSPSDTTSTNYLLTGLATDDTGVSRLTTSLNKNKPKPIKLKHGKFQQSLVLKNGSNIVRITAVDAAGHTTVQHMHVVVGNPTSNDLIDAAVKNGKLDHGHALLFKVFAAFGDPRLPGKYAGDDSRITDNHILDRVITQFDELSPDMQRKLIPYFIPPFYRGSWFSLRYDGSNQSRTSVNRTITANESYSIRPAVFIRHDKQGINEPLFAASVYHHSFSDRGSEKKVLVSDALTPPCKLNPGDCQIAKDWRYIDWKNADGKGVRVWYLYRHMASDDAPPKDGMAGFNAIGPEKSAYKKQAEVLLNEIKTKIWPKLTKLMNRTPLSDASLSTNGGNGLLDVALVPGELHVDGDAHPSYYGLTIKNKSKWGCETKPVYIELRRTLTNKNLRDDMSHEFMHSLQWTYNVDAWCLDNYEWLMESTAQWAIDYVYKKDNFEHIYGENFVKHPDISLERKSYSDESAKTCGFHCYDSYLFFFYLSHEYSPRWIRSIWEATENASTNMKAVQLGLKNAGSTNLDKRFPEFARRNWDSGPEKQYQKWDDLVVHPRLTLDKTIDELPLGSETLQLPVSLRHLSSAYYKVGFSNPDVRSVAVYNGYGYKLSRITRKRTGIVGNLSESRLANSDVWAVTTLPPKDRKGRHLEALVNIDHEWKKWKDGKPYVDVGPGIAFCGNSSDKHLDALILVASNSRMPGKDDVLAPRGDPPLVYASNMGCGPWKGTIEANDDGTSSEHGQWTFTTNFTTGPMGLDSAPITTEGQLKKAIAGGMSSSGVGDMNDIAGFLSGGAGKGGPVQNGTAGAGMPFGWPTRGRFISPFGAILSFGTGVTKWSAEYPNCGRTSGEYKDFIVVWTYNFVRSGDLYRHYVLLFAPVPWWSLSGLPYRVWDPESKSCDMGHRDPPGQPFMGTMENDGVHAQGSVSGSDYEAGDGSANYYFHLQTGAGKQ